MNWISVIDILKQDFIKALQVYGNFIVGYLLLTVGRFKSTLFCTDDYQHLKTRLLSTESSVPKGAGMECDDGTRVLEQFISLTTTKLTANVHTAIDYHFLTHL